MFQKVLNKTKKVTELFPKKVKNISESNSSITEETENNSEFTSTIDSNTNFETGKPYSYNDSNDRQSINSDSASVYFDSDTVDSSIICEDPEMINDGPECNNDYNNVTHEHEIEMEKSDSSFECEQNIVNAIDCQELFSNDIGQWPKDLSKCHIDYWIEKGSADCQHKDSDFTLSMVSYEKNVNRFCGRQFFTRVHPKTKEKLDRNWLCYSKSKKKLFCFSCTLLRPLGCTENNVWVEGGYNDWKNAMANLQKHEKSAEHTKAFLDLALRKKRGQSVNAQLLKQIENEKNYWRSLLKCEIEIIKYCAERNLPMRGDNNIIGSPHNGHYLGLNELLAKFNPFLDEHLKKYGNVGRGNTSYLSNTVCDEFIELIGSSMLDTIVNELKECKFFSVSLDSTPDITKIDQLTLIMRYVLPTGPVERFFTFLGMDNHTGEELAQRLLDFLKKHGIEIKNCRGQSYDNASNMSGVYNGLQARIKEINKYAEYIPCFAHSLNLVGKCAVESCTVAVFYLILLMAYTHFILLPRVDGLSLLVHYT